MHWKDILITSSCRRLEGQEARLSVPSKQPHFLWQAFPEAGRQGGSCSVSVCQSVCPALHPTQRWAKERRDSTPASAQLAQPMELSATAPKCSVAEPGSPASNSRPGRAEEKKGKERPRQGVLSCPGASLLHQPSVSHGPYGGVRRGPAKDPERTMQLGPRITHSRDHSFLCEVHYMR